MPRRLKHRLRYRVKAVKLNVKDSAAFLAYHVIVPVGSSVEAVIEEFYATPNHAKGRPGVAVSLSTFIPKPFTPFEFEPQLDEAGVKERQAHLKSINNDRKIVISWSKYDLSLIEAVLARGDRRTSKAIYAAWKKGCKLDGWDEHFKFDK